MPNVTALRSFVLQLDIAFNLPLAGCWMMSLERCLGVLALRQWLQSESPTP